MKNSAPPETTPVPKSSAASYAALMARSQELRAKAKRIVEEMEEVERQMREIGADGRSVARQDRAN